MLGAEQLYYGNCNDLPALFPDRIIDTITVVNNRLEVKVK